MFLCTVQNVAPKLVGWEQPSGVYVEDISSACPL